MFREPKERVLDERLVGAEVGHVPLAQVLVDLDVEDASQLANNKIRVGDLPPVQLDERHLFLARREFELIVHILEQR